MKVDPDEGINVETCMPEISVTIDKIVKCKKQSKFEKRIFICEPNMSFS